MSNASDFIIENGVLTAYNGNDACMVIPEGVTTIGFQLLADKTHVTSVVIPPSVTKIENLAFCGKWTWVDHPECFTIHLTDLDAFCRLAPQGIVTFLPHLCDTRFIVNGQVLEELNFPAGISNVSTLFKRCEDLKKVVIPEGVTEIAEEAFARCRNLTYVSLPSSLEKIGTDAFSACGLTRLDIPEESPCKIGRIFGYTYPAGLGAQTDALARRMDAEGIKNYIIPDGWSLLSEDTKARIFLTYQDAKMKKTYKKLLKPADCDPLSEAILARLGAKLTKKECDILAQFMLDYTAHLSGYCLKTMYDAIAAQKTGAAALKLLDANAGLKKKIASAPAKPKPQAQKANRTKHDVAFDNMEFDDNGVKVYELGPKQIHAVMQSDFSLLLLDPATGKTSKSIPKRGADAQLYAAATADLKAIQKGLKTLVHTCRELLYGLYLSGETLPAKQWSAEWTGNPVTRGLASMVVWQQGNTFFALDDRQPLNADDSVYALTGDPIRVAHTMDMSAECLSGWQKFFTSRQRKQPFLQIWEPCRAQAEIREDRYKGCAIRPIYLHNRKTLGIKAEWYNQEWFDGDIYQSRVLELEGFEIEAIGNEEATELEITRIVPQRWDRRTNAIVTYLDRITVYGRIHNDDTTIVEVLEQFSLEQIEDFIRVAAEHSCPNVTALLLDYKARQFGYLDPMDEFILEL